MRKLLIYIAMTASLSGCSTFLDESSGIFGEIIPRTLDDLPLVYKPQVQQGNIITQEMVNRLEPGQLKRQVQFILGTPMLSDPFHDNRWDYFYSVKTGSKIEQRKHLAVFFEEDRLIRIEGDWRPGDPPPESEMTPEKVVSVPDWEPPRRTLLERMFGWAGLGPDSGS